MPRPAGTLPADALRVRAAQVGMFESPILHGQVQDAAALNAALRDTILARRVADTTGIARSNIGGWHSATDMLAWGGDPAGQLADLAIRMAKRASHFKGRDPAGVDWTLKMWANISPPGALNTSHAHPGVL